MRCLPASQTGCSGHVVLDVESGCHAANETEDMDKGATTRRGIGTAIIHGLNILKTGMKRTIISIQITNTLSWSVI